MKILEKIRSLRKIQIILIIVVLWTLGSILVLLLDPAARKGPLGFGPPAPMRTFDAKYSGFTISYPGNWSAFETPQGSHGDNEIKAVIIVAGRYGANVTIARQAIQNGDISKVVAWGQSRAEVHPEYHPLLIRPLEDSNLGGFIQEYTWLGDDQYHIITHCQDTYVFAKNAGYALSFCSNEQDWAALKDIFVQMSQSFTVE